MMDRKLVITLGLLLLCVITEQKHKGHQKPLTAQGVDCSAIKALTPGAISGIYTIQPKGVQKPFKVYCEMLTDGGWTVFQRRTGGSVSFYRNWNEYKHGFGYLKKDHWLGLTKIRALTRGQQGQTSLLRVDLWDFEGRSAFAEYRDFKIGDERSAFKLSVGAYKGTAGDAIRGRYRDIDQNGFGFSTKDRDNDGCTPCIFGDIAENECTFSEGGGWWYSRCGSARLHGDWHPAGDNTGWASGLHWDTWKGPEPYSLQATRMMVKTV